MSQQTNTTQLKVNWVAVCVFYILACLFSWPFFAWRDLYAESWISSTWPKEIRSLAIMWGPGLAAIVCFLLFKKNHVKTIHLFGTSLFASILFFIIPYVIWAIFLIINPDSNTIQPTYLIKLIPFGFLMIIGEELGWRGFLQDALRPIKEWKRWLILGLMWEFWHFTRGITHGTPLQLVFKKMFMIAAVCFITVVIGKLTERTKSLLVAITLHSWFNIQFEFSHLNTHLATLVSAVVWFILIWKWDIFQYKNNR